MAIMTSFLLEPMYYNWLILAAIFFIIEVASFTLIFLWLGIAASIMAAISFFAPSLSLEIQLLLFAILVVVNMLILYKVFRKNHHAKGNSQLNNRMSGYVGRKVVVVEAIVSGRGKIKIDGTLWQVSCNEDLPVGSEVEVLSKKGTLFEVTKVQ